MGRDRGVVVLGVYASVTDIRRAVIPRRAVWPAGAAVALLLGAAAVVDDDLARFGLAAVGAASVAVVLELVWRRWPEQIGFGDVRLIIVNSLLAGWWGPSWSWWALMAGAVAEWPVAAVSLARRGAPPKCAGRQASSQAPPPWWPTTSGSQVDDLLLSLWSARAEWSTPRQQDRCVLKFE